MLGGNWERQTWRVGLKKRRVSGAQWGSPRKTSTRGRGKQWRHLRRKRVKSFNESRETPKLRNVLLWALCNVPQFPPLLEQSQCWRLPTHAQDCRDVPSRVSSRTISRELCYAHGSRRCVPTKRNTTVFRSAENLGHNFFLSLKGWAVPAYAFVPSNRVGRDTIGVSQVRFAKVSRNQVTRIGQQIR